MIIGLTLAGNALSDAAPIAVAEGTAATITNSGWVRAVSLVTQLFNSVLFKVS
jgi:hypothetical protein